MFLNKGQLKIFIITAIYLFLSFIIFSNRKNYEFIMYIGVIIFVLIVILVTNKKINYPNFVLWGMSVWGLLHMAGGGFILKNGRVLYSLILIPLSEEYGIFRFDQFVHIVGFGVATLLMYFIIKPHLSKDAYKKVSFAIVIIMAGFGVGALNEIIEFTATVLVPETGVGGYVNTSLDLVSDLLGAIIAYLIIFLRKGKI